MARPKPAATMPAAPAAHILSETFSDPDVVDRIFEYVLQVIPEIGARVEPLKRAVRAEFGQDEHYIRAQDETPKQRAIQIRAQVGRMFNGRNASEIARVLGVSRATVYRCLKQPGGTETA